MKVIINYQEYADVAIERAVLAELPGVEIIESRTRDEAEFAVAAGDADGAIIQYVPCRATAMAAMEKCRVIVRYGIAVDTIDLAAAKARGIRVCHVPHYCLDEVSNHALALMLALHRKLLPADRLLREDRHELKKLQPIPRLKEMALGLLGFGNIARVLAGKCRALFAEIMACDPFVGREEMAALGVRQVELPELFAASDFLSIHAPLNDATRALVNADLLALMKPTAFIVNTSRGAVIDEAALVEALVRGRIAGAGLDVFEAEPLPAGSPLRRLENVILTSHVAWYSEGAIRELKETAAREALRVLRGEEPLYEVK